MVAGLLALVSGTVGAAYLGARQATGGGSAGDRVAVLVATAGVPTGTAGGAAIGDGRIVARWVAPDRRPPDAVGAAAEISAKVAATAIAPGAVVTTSMFSAPQTRIGTIVIPAGRRALAVEMEPVAGLAGFAGAGDRIDVYAVTKGEGQPSPGVRLVLQGVEVLSVNGTGIPTAQGQPGSPNLIYLVAVTPTEAEKVIYLKQFEKLYFDLIPQGEGPVRTPGAGPTSAMSV